MLFVFLYIPNYWDHLCIILQNYWDVESLVAGIVPWWCYEHFVFGCCADGLLVCGLKH
jgi:hypothetical protein